MVNRKTVSIYIIILILLVGLTYLFTLSFNFVSDDIPAIQNNFIQIKQGSEFTAHPRAFVRNILFLISAYSCGALPACFRIWNIVFHLGVTILVYMITIHLTSNRKVAFFSAGLVAVHPILIESVTWISGGIYTQSVFFLLVSFYFFLIYLKKSDWIYLLFSLVSYIFALSSSTKVIILPLVLVLYLFSFDTLVKKWKYSLPYFAVSFIWGLILIPAIYSRVAFVNLQAHTDAVFYNPLIYIPVVVSRYLILIAWPKGLSIYHSSFQVNTYEYIFYLVLFLLYISSIMWAFKRNRLLFFCLTLFFVSLLPILNPFGLASINAERYVYLGSIGLFITFSYIIFKSRLIKNQKSKVAIAVVIVVLLMFRAIMRNIDWSSSEHLWKSAVKVNPAENKALTNLAEIYIDQGKLNDAHELLISAIQIDPAYAYPYHNLGLLYQKQKEYPKAMDMYAKAIERDPSLWQSYQNMGSIYYSLNEYSQAEKLTIKAIKLAPNNDNLYANLGYIYLRQGKKNEAQNAFVKSLQINAENNFAKSGLNNLNVN